MRLVLILRKMVPMTGVEPVWISPHDFESCAYANSATSANKFATFILYQYKLNQSSTIYIYWKKEWIDKNYNIIRI